MTVGVARPVVTSPIPREVWASLVRSDPSALVSQSLAWRDSVFADGRYRDVGRLYTFDSGEKVAIPLARSRGIFQGISVTASWPRVWGVGGPICQGGRVDAGQARMVLDDLVSHSGLAAEIQLGPEADGSWIAAAERFMVEKNGNHVVDIRAGFDHVWRHKFRGSARTAIRKAEKSGLDVEVDQSGRLLHVFWDLYENSMRRWSQGQHEPLWFTRWRTARATPPRMLATVAHQFGADFNLLVARSAGEPVAAIIVLRAGRYTKYWRGAMNKDLANRVRANEYLHRLAIEQACRDGYDYYDLGRSRPGSALAAFKEKLGGTPQFGHTLRIERLPVSTGAQLARDIVKRAIRFHDV
ncbi:MAG: GNAT family N-acetyltransferase [Streptosporangiaceae bacterium]